MKKGLRLLFIFALLITLVACGDREIPTFDDILNQTVDVGSDARNWEDLLENLSDNETPVDALVIEVDDNVNYNVPGTYTVTITVTDESNNKAAFTFNVTVEDNEKPVVTLNGSASLTVTEGDTFTDPGATYTDNVDGTGSAKVSGTVDMSTPGSYTLTYSYTDEAGNQADSVTRTVVVEPRDTVAPVVTLIGDATITIQLGETFTDPGATYSDNLDGTGSATASGNVDVNTVGSYTITYTATDSSGNTGSATRTVVVSDTPPRLAQYAPEDDSEFGIGNYFKFGNIEAFLLNYEAKTLLVIFEGQDVLGEIEFGKQPTGPNSPMPNEPFFNNLYAISENGLLIESYDFMNNSQKSIVFNLNTKQVDENVPSGFVNWYATGPNQGPTSYLTEFEGYFYIVEGGDDRGLYTFNADLTLTQHVIFQRDFDNVYFTYKDDTYIIMEVSSYGQNYYQGAILLETATNEILQTYNNWISRNLLGENLIISYNDNSLTDNQQVLQVWTSPTQMTTEYVGSLYFFNDENNNNQNSPINKATSLAVTYYDSVNQERQVRIYDETYSRLVTHVYGQYSWSIDQVGDYIVVLDVESNVYTLRAFKNDGSAEVTITDFGLSTTRQSVSTAYLNTYNYGPFDQPFRYLYVVQGWNDDMDDSTYKAFYFEEGTIKIFDLPGPLTNNSNNYFIENNSKLLLTSRTSVWNSVNNTYSNTIFTAHVYDFETESLTSTTPLDLGVYVGNTYSNFSYIEGYALYTFGEDNSYNTTKHLLLFDLENNTTQFGSLESTLNQSSVNNLNVDGDTITISFNSTALISSVSDFGTFTEGEPTFGGGSGSVYDMQDIINTDDLKLEMQFGEMGPMLVISLNGVELLSVNVMNTSYQVYVYDVEGTENDTIFIGFRQAGYVIDLSDPNFTEYYGVVTSGGFLTLDDNYNESFDVLPLDSSMVIDHWEYYVQN